MTFWSSGIVVVVVVVVSGRIRAECASPYVLLLYGVRYRSTRSLRASHVLVDLPDSYGCLSISEKKKKKKMDMDQFRQLYLTQPTDNK